MNPEGNQSIISSRWAPERGVMFATFSTSTAIVGSAVTLIRNLLFYNCSRTLKCSTWPIPNEEYEFE